MKRRNKGQFWKQLCDQCQKLQGWQKFEPNWLKNGTLRFNFRSRVKILPSCGFFSEKKIIAAKVTFDVKMGLKYAPLMPRASGLGIKITLYHPHVDAKHSAKNSTNSKFGVLLNFGNFDNS